MDLVEALRSTGAVRDFLPEPVPDDVLSRILEVARFAPNGGNRQAWRVVAVRDPATKAALRDIYLEGWYDYLAIKNTGVTPFSPLADRDAEARAVEAVPALKEAAKAQPGFAERFHEVPVLVVLLADLNRLAALDRDLDRYTFVGGASIYPFAWSILLAARSEGLGGVFTTMVTKNDAAVRELLGAPDDHAVAGVIALGRPVHQPTRLRREPVASFATVDRFDGAPLA